VGKSILTFNLGERLASGGFRTLLVDADISCGNLHVLSNTSGLGSIDQFATGVLGLEDAVESCGENLDLLPASGEMTAEEVHGVTSGSSLIEFLRRQAVGYDFVLIDHASGVSEFARSIAVRSDLALIVVVPELTSIADAYGLYKHLIGIDSSVDARLVVNRAEEVGEADYITTKFQEMTQQFVGLAPAALGYVSEDHSVRRAIASQQAIAAVDADSRAVQNLNSISEQLIQWSSDERALTPLTKTNNQTAQADIRG
jgi:MinD-like ATPase involved in chromosome partitioning or flagellar assembly